MNHEHGEFGALPKLITIRRADLDVLRRDLLCLAQLQAESARQVHEAQRAEVAFIDETCQAEEGEAPLFADQMIGRRRYLAHLRHCAAEAEQALRDVADQQDLAHAAFERLYGEVRALERLAERRQIAAAIESRRQAYSLADDEELARNQHALTD